MKCLIVVDYQVDFVKGTLGFEGAEKLDSVISGKIDKYRYDGGEVIFTFDTHSEDYLQTNEGRHLPVEHCIKGTDGHKLFGKTAEKLSEKDNCFYKPSFGSAELFEYLKNKNYKSIELCGLVSNICVISNAILAKTACPEAEIIVDSDATASNDKNLNTAAFDVMRSLQIEVI